MKTKLLLALVALVIFVAVAVFIWPGAHLANAALGNSGIPVSCFHSGNIDSGKTLSCQAADGTAFVGGQSVPSGYSLMVTDVLITCTGGGAASTQSEVLVKNAISDGSYDTFLDLVQISSATGHYAFTVPYLVLPTGHRLDVNQSGIASTCGANVKVSGLLVTNLIYMPMIAR